MSFLKKIKKGIKKLLYTKHPVAAYNILAEMYDSQEGNLLMELDEKLLGELLVQTNLKGKTLLDIGCGTGRHWDKLNKLSAEKIIGADSSEKMLEVLVKKIPGAEVYLASGSKIKELKNNSADIIISTLTIGYMKDIEAAFLEWQRLLKNGGEILITEYHPELLQMGGGRTFQHKQKTIAIKNFIHSIEKIRSLAKHLDWHEIRFSEKKIDEELRSYYEKRNALTAYEKFKGTPIIYGLHFRKHDRN